MVTLQFTNQSKKDLKSIHTYIAKDSKVNATRFIEQLIQRAKILKSYPEIGHLVFPDKYKKLRQLLYKAYRIVYYYQNETITIITIHHQSRLIQNIPAVRNYEE